MTSQPNSLSQETFYIDTSVLLNTVDGFGNPQETRASREFMKCVTDGLINGVISPWVVLEMIHVIRGHLIDSGFDKYRIIEQETVGIATKLCAFPKLRIIWGKEAYIGQEPIELWVIMKESLRILRSSKYTAVDDPKRGRVLEGIGSNDALHIAIALKLGCDVLATCDKGFWSDKHQIPIYDVKNKVRR